MAVINWRGNSVDPPTGVDLVLKGDSELGMYVVLIASVNKAFPFVV